MALAVTWLQLELELETQQPAANYKPEQGPWSDSLFADVFRGVWVKSSQVKSSQVKSSQVKSSQVKSSQVKSSQVKSSQVKSSQVKSIYFLKTLLG